VKIYNANDKVKTIYQQLGQENKVIEVSIMCHKRMNSPDCLIYVVNMHSRVCIQSSYMCDFTSKQRCTFHV